MRTESRKSGLDLRYDSREVEGPEVLCGDRKSTDVERFLSRVLKSQRHYHTRLRNI